MTTQEKLNRLRAIPTVIAYPTAMTYDMGLEFEAITDKGFYGNMGQFGSWPIYDLQIKDELKELVEAIRRGEEVDVDTIADYGFEELVRDEEELATFIEFVLNLPSDATHIYALADQAISHATAQYFATRFDVEEAFIDTYVSETPWDEAEDATINYMYDMAEEHGWTCCVRSNYSDEENEEGDACEKPEPSEAELLEKGKKLYEQAEGAACMGQGERANELLQRSVDCGYALAMLDLGVNYMEAQGIICDPPRAVSLWERAGELGNADAQFNAALAYARGVCGVEKDYTKANYWCLKAAEQGCADAIANIGQFYFYGHGVEQDYAKAVEWLKRGIDAGAEMSFFKFLLGYCYEKGLGTKVENSAAIRLYESSLEISYSAKALQRLQTKGLY